MLRDLKSSIWRRLLLIQGFIFSLEGYYSPALVGMQLEPLGFTLVIRVRTLLFAHLRRYLRAPGLGEFERILAFMDLSVKFQSYRDFSRRHSLNLKASFRLFRRPWFIFLRCLRGIWPRGGVWGKMERTYGRLDTRCSRKWHQPSSKKDRYPTWIMTLNYYIICF